MAESMDTCPHCGSTLITEAAPDDAVLDVRMPCENPDCPGKWTASEAGGDRGMRPSYDVPGLTGGAVAD